MTTKQFEQLAKKITGLNGKYIGKCQAKLEDGSILTIGENIAVQKIDTEEIFQTIMYQKIKDEWKSFSESSYSKKNTENTNGNILEDVLTFAEAAQKYGLSDGAVLRNYVKRGLFQESDYRKSGNVWLIKKSAMERLFRENAYNKLKEPRIYKKEPY